MIKMNFDKKLVFHTVLSFGTRLFGTLISFFLSIVIARNLGIDEAGLFFLAFSVVTFLAAFVRVGFDNTILRLTSASLAANEKDMAKSVLNAALKIVIPLASLIATILLIFGQKISEGIFSKPEFGKVLQLSSPSIIFISIATLLGMSLQAHQRVIPSNFIKLVSINLITIILLLFFPTEKAETAILLFSLGSVITTVFAYILLHRHLKGLHSKTLSWSHLAKSFIPLWMVMIMSQLLTWSGQFVAATIVETAELAQLSAAQRVAALGSFLLTAVNMVIAPHFATYYRIKDFRALHTLARNSMLATLALSTPIFACMVFWPGSLMGLFGDDFQPAAKLLQILCVGQFINVATGSVSILLQMTGHEKDVRNTLFFVAPISIFIALLLTPWLGVTGSAIASSIAMGSQNLIATFWVKKRLGFSIFQR